MLYSVTGGLGNSDVTSRKLLVWNICVLETGTTVPVLGQDEELCAVEVKENSNVEHESALR